MREALKLHGLSASQIATIEMERKLLRDASIETPDIDSHNKNEELLLTRLALPSSQSTFTANVWRNQSPASDRSLLKTCKIQKGTRRHFRRDALFALRLLKLNIEGQAFEQDTPIVTKAAQNGWDDRCNDPDDDRSRKLSMD